MTDRDAAPPPLRLVGGAVLRDGALRGADVCIAGGRIAGGAGGPAVDVSEWMVLPGIVDAHGDGFERHVAARRGALSDTDAGLVALEAELAANGITTAILAQFYSWEGGMRGPEFAARLAAAHGRVAPGLATDLRLQLRLETHLTDAFADALDLIDRAGIGAVVFNDHLPHDRLAAGRTPRRLTGQALKGGRSPEAHLALMQALHADRGAVPGALTALAEELRRRGVAMGSHDDHTPETRAWFRDRGASIAEFPETHAAAAAAHAGGDSIVLGAPNVVRGASHAGKVSARALIAEGLCDALASDYHYPAPRHAALSLVRDGICDLPAAWRLVSEGPARLLGLDDRGTLAEGARADVVILDPESGRVGATIAGGRITYLTTPLAERFIAARA